MKNMLPGTCATNIEINFGFLKISGERMLHVIDRINSWLSGRKS